MSSTSSCLRGGYLTVLFYSFLLIAPFGKLLGESPREAGIRVQLVAKNRLSLHVTLTSGAEEAVTISRAHLPWESQDSILVTLTRANGQCLKRNVFVEDPLLDRIAIEPNKPISGDVDLERAFPDLKKVLHVSDVHLFWAYNAPEGLKIPAWSGGWIFIPRQE